MPKISVIVPVYRVEKYLPRCIDSILNQTFHDFDLILIDDGSPDQCPNICDGYARIDKRIKVIHQTNGGLASARNAGIEWALINSDSEWLSFIDSDDWVHPQFLELLYQAVLEHHADISVCDFEKTTEFRMNFKVLPQNMREGINLIPPNSRRLIISDVRVKAVVVWNKLYRKILFKNIRYPNGKLHEDEFTTYKLLWMANRIFLLEETLYYYYQREESIMRTRYSPERFSLYDALIEQAKFYYKNQMADVSSVILDNALDYFEFQIREVIPDTKENRRKCRCIYCKFLLCGLQVWKKKHWIGNFLNICPRMIETRRAKS